MTGPRAARVLVVEDDSRVTRLVRAVLETDGYSVRIASTGVVALEILDAWSPQLILLDIGLPGDLDGYQLCHLFRASSSASIIMLTGQGTVEDKVRGLDAGADDYLTKPFASKELLARARAVLRRSRPTEDGNRDRPIACGQWLLDPVQERVTFDGREIPLTGTEFRVLAELARNANSVVSHERLLDTVWGPECRGEIEYLRTYIRRLRSKIEDNGAPPRHIVSKTNVGYMLVTRQ